MIFFVGTFPPPTHGMSLINQAVCQRLRLAGMQVEELNTALISLKRDFHSRSSRWTGILRAWAALLKSAKRGDWLYLSVSGGWGQGYDLVSLFIARFKGMRCIVHHHNFAYLDRVRGLTKVVVRMAGVDAIHVALCGEMARRLRSAYAVHQAVVLSNITFLPEETCERSNKGPRAVGFLSNLTAEKGAGTLLDLAWAIKRKGLPFRVIVAGPCHDDDLNRKLGAAVSNGVLEWRGEVSGEGKAAFWKEVDAFVFPSRSEAEPLVVFEALMNGVPVISYSRGCIPEQAGNAGTLVSPDADFVNRALQVLEHWSADPAEYERQQQASTGRYQSMKRDSARQWQQFLERLSDGASHV